MYNTIEIEWCICAESALLPTEDRDLRWFEWASHKVVGGFTVHSFVWSHVTALSNCSFRWFSHRTCAFTHCKLQRQSSGLLRPETSWTMTPMCESVWPSKQWHRCVWPPTFKQLTLSYDLWKRRVYMSFDWISTVLNQLLDVSVSCSTWSLTDKLHIYKRRQNNESIQQAEQFTRA